MTSMPALDLEVPIPCDTPSEQVSPREVGGKAWNLLRLRELGYPVPRFVILPCVAFEEVLGDGLREIEAALAGLDALDPEAAAGAAEQVVAIVEGRPWPARWGDALAAALPGASSLAVRSSVVGEDGAQHSFAGLMDSRLGVPRHGLPAAVRGVWASAFSGRALAYRQRKGLARSGIRTAVIVQEMADVAVSGVLFTRDPRDSSPGCVIAAAHGLGEGVVADAAESDTYCVKPGTDQVVSEVRPKLHRVVLAAAGGTARSTLPAGLRGRPVLDEKQVLRLRDLGLALAQAMGAPQDVEWAFAADGRLAVLQARPLLSAPRSGVVRVWDNANIVESYPGLTLPLTFSFARRAYARAFRRGSRGFLPPWSAGPAPEVFESLLGLLHGRVYYSLRAWYQMLAFLPGARAYRVAWDRLVGVVPGTELPPVSRGVVTRVYGLLGAVRLLLGVERNARAFFRRFDAFYARYRESGAEAGTPDQGILALRALEEDAAGFWHRTLHNDFCAIRYQQWLAALCQRAGAGLDMVNRLLAGESGIESLAPVRSLSELAGRVRRQPRWLAALAGDSLSGWQRIQHEPELADLRAALAEHLAAFGDRAPEELKLESITFREQPARLLALLREQVQRSRPAGLDEERIWRERVEAERSVAGGLRLGPERAVFRFVLRQARSALRAREDMRFARARLFGIARRLFRRLGELLTERGVLESAMDVHSLTLQELSDFVEGTAVTTELKALVSLRRSEYAAHAAQAPADSFTTLGPPSLDPGAPGPVTLSSGPRARGTGCSAGVATGKAQVVLDPQGARRGCGTVIVARATDPGWVFLMLDAAGLVVERGSPLSHTAIVGRELGIPTVVGVAGATRLIPEGAEVTLDGSTGEVWWR